MISKAELMNQKTKRESDMEQLEKDIDRKIKEIKPDTIVNRRFFIKVTNFDYERDVIQEVLSKYVECGGYSLVEFDHGVWGFDKKKSLDISFTL